MIDEYKDIIAQAVSLDDGTLTHCDKPVYWNFHDNPDNNGDPICDGCYAWECAVCLVMSDYDCEEN